jgi:hypothetical protein
MAMRSLVVAAALCAASTRSYATAADRQTTLVAWSRDGAAALIEQRTETARGYVLVAAGERPIAINVSDLRDDEAIREQVPLWACLDGAKQLAAAVSAHRFVGVDVRAKNCERAGRNVVTLRSSAARDVKRSWVTVPHAGRAPTAREATSWAIVASIAPDYRPTDDNASCGEPRGMYDVANKSGKLVLVFAGRCVSPARVTVQGFTPRGDAYVAVNISRE